MKLTRRTVLTGAGVALGLPLLHSALPRASWGQSVPSPTRLVVFYIPNGMQMVCFTPDSEGADYGLKECTQPLEPVKQHVSVLTGFANENAIDSVPGDHARGTGSFLTCVPVRHTAGNDIYNGISMDQVAAQALGEQTPLPSVQIGIQPGGNTGDCTAGYSCAYTRNLAWADERTPLPNITNPAVLFDRMFGADDGLSPAARALRAQLRASVLDEVRDEAALLSTRLGRNDRLKLDQYLTAVREVELRSNALGGSCGGAERPPADVSYAEHVAVMTELMALGLECDITRVITFMLGPGGSNQTYDFLGVPAAHHQISHHQNDEKNIADLVTIANWEVAQFAALVERLAATSDGSGSLLDSSLLYFSSEIEDGDQHLHTNLPVLLAGGANGAHVTGVHRRFAENRPIADLYLWMLQTMGVNVQQFGADGRTPTSELGDAV